MSLAADGGRAAEAPAPGAPGRTGDLAEEFDFHLEMLAREAEAAGADPVAAEHAARERFGDPGRYARRCLLIEEGGRTMMRRILIGVNIGVIVLLSLGLIVTFLMARSAQQIALARAETAVQAEMSARHAAQEALRAVWFSDSGLIRVEGAVAKPGEQLTSLERPLTLRQIIEAAGGSTEGASHVTVVLPDQMGEQHIPLRDAVLPRTRNEVTPPPRSVVVVK